MSNNKKGYPNPGEINRISVKPAGIFYSEEQLRLLVEFQIYLSTLDDKNKTFLEIARKFLISKAKL